MKKNFMVGNLLIIGLLSSCVSGASDASANAAPGWLFGATEYPSERFLTAQAAGSSLREARRNAAGELASLFAARIDFDSTASFHYEEDENSSSKSRGVEQSVRVSSNQEIYGIEYTEPYRALENGEVKIHILAYLDREKVGKLYSERIEDRRNQIAALRLRSSKLSPESPNAEDVLAGFILYDYSLDQAMRNQLLLEQLQIINKPMHGKVARKIDYNSVDLAEQRSRFASKLSFQVDYQGDEDLLFLGEDIAEQLSQLGFVRRNTGGPLVVDIKLNLIDVETNNRYVNLAWDLQINFSRTQNIVGTGRETTLLSFAKSGRESSITRSRTLVTLKRILDEDIQREFMQQLYQQFAKFAGI